MYVEIRVQELGRIDQTYNLDCMNIVIQLDIHLHALDTRKSPEVPKAPHHKRIPLTQIIFVACYEIWNVKCI